MSRMIKCALALVLTTAALEAAAVQPLLQEGKKSLYQRVLTTPECTLTKSVSGSGGTPVPAFTRYYVYERSSGHLKVGPDTTGKIAGWISEGCAVPWKAQTALVFTNPAGRDRALVFKERSQLNAIVEAKDPAKQVKPLVQAVSSGGTAPGLVAAEPANYVDYQKQFYLLPVLEAEETMFDDGGYTRMLKVASVTQKPKQQPQAADAATIKAFRAALVFVIDSTISMQPYIDRTKKAIDTIYKRIESEHLEQSVQFGLVSFRTQCRDQSVSCGIEYAAKMFVNPGEVTSGDTFAEKLRDLKEAPVSTPMFDEDSFAGVYMALSEINWKEFGGRYVVLITDAGAVEGSHRLSTTRMDSTELRLEAEHRGAAIYALHLLTPAGKADHAKAQAQYEDLTYNRIVQKPLYFPVNTGNVQEFGKKIDQLAEAITDQVKLASEGRMGTGSVDAVQQAADDRQGIDESVRLLGLAMQLAYLGSAGNTAAPPFYSGWLSDRDLVKHNLPVATPVVLLTKGQLSNLSERTRGILNAANTGMIDPDDMFGQLRSLAVSAGRDPALLGQGTAVKIAELGLMDEYLEDLPYRSTIQDIDEEAWTSMGPDEQNQIIESLENKLAYYQKCNDDNDRWVSLSKGADASESVYPVPLDMLP